MFTGGQQCFHTGHSHYHSCLASMVPVCDLRWRIAIRVIIPDDQATPTNQAAPSYEGSE